MSTPEAPSNSGATLRSTLVTIVLTIGLLGLGSAVLSGTVLDETLPDIAGVDLEGRSVSLKSLCGQPVVLYFFATWCGACSLSSPTIGHFADRHPDVPVLALTSESSAEVRQALGNDLPAYRVVVSAGQMLARLGVRALPTTAIVDASGRVTWSRQGVLLPGELDLRLPGSP